MGCGVSNSRKKPNEVNVSRESSKEDGDLKAGSCKLSYSQQQLSRLNQKFLKILECSGSNLDPTRERQIVHLAIVVERLIQRLVCNAGNLDPRFSSKFLINLEPLQKSGSYRNRLRFKYLVRLDAISTPALYPEFHEPPVRIVEETGNESVPEGYAKIRVHGEYLEHWAEFINSGGYLRSDKIEERFVELLARAAARPSEPFCPAQVDESRLCGSPGKIVDPITLYHVLKLAPNQQMYYGPAECNESRFPDPRDFRIAIVEGIPETRLHISFLSPTAQSLAAEEEIEISLIIGIGVAGWPQGTNFPTRLPLDHVDVILGYRSAQMGYYLVPKSPHYSVRCDDRCSLWEIRTIATEMILEQHYSPSSVTGRIYRILLLLLETLKARGVKTINRYILKNLLFYELETKKGIKQWTPKSISRRVLSILDHLLSSLRSQSLPSYIFANKNLLLQDDALEEDYVSDGDILEHYMRQLFHDGGKTEANEIDILSVKDQLEYAMLYKWENVMTNLSPPISNRSRRLSVAKNSPASISYTRRQMEYIAILFREILKLKHIQQKQNVKEFSRDKPVDDFQDRANNKEDFIYLLRIMFDQAKQRICSELINQQQQPHHSKTVENAKKLMKMNRVIDSYDVSTAMMIDDLKRCKQTNYQFNDDMQLVAKVIESLYKAIDSDGRILGPILRPYLNQLFKGSHENCWFLPEWKKKTDMSEFEAIGAFSSLVISENIDPLEGILDSVNKGWNWAKNCLHILQSITDENSAGIFIGEKFDSNESGLRIILTPIPQKTIRYNIRLPRRIDLFKDEVVAENSTTKSSGKVKSNVDNRYATIRSFQDTLYNAVNSVEKEIGSDNWELKNHKDVDTLRKLRSWCEKQPPHSRLRDANPLTIASVDTRRQGTHRGLGNIVQALISLQKLTVLQEISQFLPGEERTRVLNDIKKLSKEVERLSVSNYRRRRSLSVLDGNRNRFSFKKSNKVTKQDVKPKSATLPNKTTGKSSTQKDDKEEIYRCLNELSNSKEKEIQRELEDREKKLDEELRKTKEESLLGTCRLLRRQYRQTVFDSGTLYTPPRRERYRNPAATLPKNPVINTPFYIKVSAFNSANREMTEI